LIIDNSLGIEVDESDIVVASALPTLESAPPALGLQGAFHSV